MTGHTDTVGSMAYNQRLSERRADAVKTEMVREGLNANDVTTVGRNFAGSPGADRTRASANHRTGGP